MRRALSAPAAAQFDHASARRIRVAPGNPSPNPAGKKSAFFIISTPLCAVVQYTLSRRGAWVAAVIPDDIFARQLNQMGIVTLDEIEAAMRAVVDCANSGQPRTLADVLVEQGVITRSTR